MAASTIGLSAWTGSVQEQPLSPCSDCVGRGAFEDDRAIIHNLVQRASPCEAFSQPLRCLAVESGVSADCGGPRGIVVQHYGSLGNLNQYGN